MARKSYKPEEIVAKLRQVDVLTSQGQSVAEAIRSMGVSEVTYYRLAIIQKIFVYHKRYNKPQHLAARC
jgi:ACT domain-containing protein